MFLEQAIFTSVRSERIEGYQLAARSPGVDDELAHALTVWGPSHGALHESAADASSLSFQLLRDDWWALGRTVIGGPEYSGRGPQIVTLYALIERRKFAGYDYHPLRLAWTALALGYLRLPLELEEDLERLELPDETCTGRAVEPQPSEGPLELVQRLLNQGERVAVLGRKDPLPTVEWLLDALPAERRLELSFATGLNPSVRRPYRLQFLPAARSDLRRRLADDDVTCVDVSAAAG